MHRSPCETLVGCVWLPRFEIQAERLRHPDLAGKPLALLAPGRQPVVTALSREAEAAGIRPGMPLREVTAVTGSVMLQEEDPHHYGELFARVLAALEAAAPLVEPAAPGTAYVELEGLGWAAGEGAPVRLEQALPPRLAGRVGIGRGKFTAWAAARRGEGPGAALSPTRRTCRVADAARKEYLRRLPASTLPVSPEMRRKLALFGLRTVGEVAALPPAALLAQFGAEGRRAWRLAHGRDDEPLRPRITQPEIAEALDFPAPEAALQALLAAVHALLERVLRRPERKGQGVRQVRLTALLEGGRTWVRTVTFRQPGTLPGHLYPPLRYFLEREHPPEAVERLTLTLAALTRGLTGQQTLFPEPPREKQARLAEELRQLRARLGRAPVAHIVAIEPESRIPERRHGLVGFDP